MGAVRANSIAVERPIPEEAPVTTMVLPVRRPDIAEADMARMSFGVMELGCSALGSGLRSRAERTRVFRVRTGGM